MQMIEKMPEVILNFRQAVWLLSQTNRQKVTHMVDNVVNVAKKSKMTRKQENKLTSRSLKMRKDVLRDTRNVCKWYPGACNWGVRLNLLCVDA